ncbi:hypothetical protein BX666DRAFT_90401 [Dichotomocladium elegans]|nr:hypothetical protein BX666DRAFT_90401 [Dichotomocladium elegans]
MAHTVTRTLSIALRNSNILRAQLQPFHRALPRYNRHCFYSTPSAPRQIASQPSNAAAVSTRTTTATDESQEKRASEIKDAKLIFNQAWKNIEDHYGRENLHMPREFIFLMGAPGSGKGTHTPSILRARGITNPPISVSQLLQTPECKDGRASRWFSSHGYPG